MNRELCDKVNELVGLKRSLEEVLQEQRKVKRELLELVLKNDMLDYITLKENWLIRRINQIG